MPYRMRHYRDVIHSTAHPLARLPVQDGCSSAPAGSAAGNGSFGASCMAAMFLLVGIALAVPARADMRCGTELIKTGDSSLRVLEACGEPMSGNPEFLEDGEWTYNFGPDEFMVRVVITDGAVQRFEQLGRGFPPTDEPTESGETY